MPIPMPRRSLLLAPLVATPALAQDRPLRLLIGMPPGATPDLLTRLLAERLSSGLGQTVVVENRPGAAGNLAATALARSAPDGGTIGTLLGATLAINRHLYPNLPFDPARDFTPLLRFARFPAVVLVPRDAPVAGLSELGPWLRGLGRPALVATPGAGTIPHLAAEMLLRAIGVTAQMVHYRGDPDALRDLAAGRVQMMVAPLPAALPQIEAGRAHGLAVTSATRSPLAPGLAAVAETIPGFIAESWLALGAPAALPASQAERLVALAEAALSDPTLRARFAALGAEIPGESGRTLAGVIAAEDARWGAVIRAAGVSLE